VQLKSFRVLNYRSINDSGEIDVSRITALLGRNESGKSNLLRALESLNPADGFGPLNPIKDFPRHRKLSECNDWTEVIRTTWELTDKEQAALTAIWPRAKGVKTVSVGRRYEGKSRWVGIPVASVDFDSGDIRTAGRKIVAAVKAKAAKLDEPAKQKLEAAADAFATEIAVEQESAKWAAAATPALATLRQALADADVDLTESQDAHVVTLEEQAEAIPIDEAQHGKARDWIVAQMPVFMFLDEYPEIAGHQDIAAYLKRVEKDDMDEADHNFEKLCKVAGLDPEQLHELLSEDDQETRTQLANRAGSVVTTAIRKRWKDRQLKVRFNLDAQHFDTLISDPNHVYDVEINLDERSRGFQWFFAFYIVFAADTQGGDAENAILLLDEPGLFLHAKSQGDLLNHLEDDFANTIIFTTHSPFMVPTHKLDSVRTVSIAEDVGTTVSNDPTGDAKTLFPLQAALGYDLAQSLFVGPHNLVVEGVTDFWIVSAVSEYLNDESKEGLHRELTVTPAGGAQKIHYMVALLTSEALNVLVLFDEEKDARATRNDLVKGKLLREDNVVFTSSAFATPPIECDIEDLFDPATYEILVRESYAKELKGKTLTLNPKVPRIARRFEQAFNDLGIEFHKTRPARLFLKKMATDPASVITADCKDRFVRLFKAVNDAFKKHLARSG